MGHRVGVVGGGNISGTHARAALEIPGTEVVAHWGGNLERTRKLAQEVGGEVYEDYTAFIRHEGMDVVMIGTPSGLHAEQGKAAAQRGIHVLSEKPLDISTARIDSLIDECEKAEVKLGVFYQDRTAPHIAWLKRLIESGGVGKPLLFSARVKWYRPPDYYASSKWRGTWALDGGGALMNQGIHTADLLVWLLGDPQRVYAHARTQLHDIEVEDTMVSCIEFEHGVVGTFEATTAAYPGYPRRLELSGTQGTVVLENDMIVSVDLKVEPEEPVPGAERDESARASSPAVTDVSGHRRIIEDFFRAIETDGTPLCDGRDGRRSVALAEAIYRSGREGMPISFSDGA